MRAWRFAAGLRLGGILGIAMMTSCGGDESGASLAFPNLTAILKGAAPAAFTTSRAASRTPCPGAYSTAAAIFTCIAGSIFPAAEDPESPAEWFLDSVSDLDTHLAEPVARFSAALPTCSGISPADLRFTIQSSANSTFFDTSDISIPVALTCQTRYKDSAGVEGVVAWGSKDNILYLVDRSFGAGGPSGVERFLTIVKVSSADEVELWGLRNGDVYPSPTLWRMKANKATKAFSYESRAGQDFNRFKYLYLRSNGSNKLFVAARANTGANLVGILASFSCIRPDDSATPVTGCDTDGLGSYPTSEFSSSNAAIGEVQDATLLYDTVDRIVDLDLRTFGLLEAAPKEED